MFTPSGQKQLSVTLKLRAGCTTLRTCTARTGRYHSPGLYFRPPAGPGVSVNQLEQPKSHLPYAMFTAVAFARKAIAGSFVLYYEGYPTTTLSHDASAAKVKAALSAIPAIRGVNVNFSIPLGGACSSAAINVIQVGHVLSLPLFRISIRTCSFCGRLAWWRMLYILFFSKRVPDLPSAGWLY